MYVTRIIPEEILNAKNISVGFVDWDTVTEGFYQDEEGNITKVVKKLKPIVKMKLKKQAKELKIKLANLLEDAIREDENIITSVKKLKLLKGVLFGLKVKREDYGEADLSSYFIDEIEYTTSDKKVKTTNFNNFKHDEQEKEVSKITILLNDQIISIDFKYYGFDIKSKDFNEILYNLEDIEKAVIATGGRIQ